MKCMPMKRSGRSVAAASRVIEIDEVLQAMIAAGFSCGTSFLKISRLTSSFSVAASITMSQSPKHAVIRRRCDARQRRLLVVLGDAAARDLARQVAVDVVDRALERLGVDVGQLTS